MTSGERWQIVGLVAFVLAFLALLAALTIGRNMLGDEPDPLLRATTCANPAWRHDIDIDPGLGRERACFRVIDDIVFANRLRVPVTVCVGRGGVCQDGHGVTAVTISAGHSQALAVRGRKNWFASATRRYPLTISGAGYGPVDVTVEAGPDPQVNP